MNLPPLVIVLVLLFCGGGFYVGGPAYAGSDPGLVLLTCLVVDLLRGFPEKRQRGSRSFLHGRFIASPRRTSAGGLRP